MKEKDIISRRKFFKKSANAIIPAIAMTVVPQIFTSCEIDEPYPGGCSDCSGGCSSGCSGTCTSSCSGSCVGCTGRCQTSCAGSCRNVCTENCSRTSRYV